MLKKIKISDVRLGMYIHEFCGDWIKHPFWKKSLELTEQKDFNTLLNSELEEVWIDTSKGLDVKVEAVAAPAEEINDPQKEIKPVVNKKKVSVQEELVAAKKIRDKAKNEVISMFSEIRMGNAIEIKGAASLVDEINQSMARNSGALLSLVRLKNIDEYTYLHSVAVCVLMVALGKRLGLEGDMLRQAGVAGLLHDVGKMAIPSEILNKPGRLTDEEFNIIKDHPKRGWEILKTSYGVSEQALDVCLHHHERVDGNGYPNKLSGKALSLFARMGAVCDVYDAITSDRCYKPGWEPVESIRKMAEWKDGHFDEKVFHAFVKTIGIYPNGTLLKLKSERLALVIEQSTTSLTTPIVNVFFSIRDNAYMESKIVDLSKSTERVVSVEDPLKWKLDLEKTRGF